MLMTGAFLDRRDYINHFRSGEGKAHGARCEVTGRRKDGLTFPIDLTVGEVVPKSETEREITRICDEITSRRKDRNAFCHRI
jgi:hypothetical protein